MITTTVRQMLDGKRDIYAVKPDDTVFHALGLMSEKNVGAVVVLENGELRGIMSERDYARKVIALGTPLQDSPVSAIMTTNVICVEPGWTVDRCMALMTDKRIRHLPVVEHGRVVGIISIGDVVRAFVDEQKFTITSLEQYILSGG